MYVLKLDYWRSFVPFAPDYEIVISEGEERRVDLPNDVLIQGARSLEDGTSPSIDLEEIPVQRGWRLNPIHQAPPFNFSISPLPTGFLLKAIPYIEAVTEPPEDGDIIDTSGDGVEECFSYTLSNGFQESNLGTFFVKVVKGYRLNVTTLHQYADYRRFHIRLGNIHNNGLTDIANHCWSWYRVTFKKTWDDVIEDYIVTKERQLIIRYGIRGYCYSSSNCTFWAVNNVWALTLDMPSDIELGLHGLWASRNKKYIATGDRGDIEIECRGYFGQINRSEYVDLKYKFSEMYGKRWWLHGAMTRDVPLEGQK